jgi:phage terminase small subunit
MALNFRQKLFALKYLKSNNATQSAIDAGYSKASAYSQAHELLKIPEIKEFIQKQQERRLKAAEVTCDRVIEELARVAFADIRGFYKPDGSMKKPHELNDDEAGAIASLETLEQFAGSGDERVKVGEVQKIKLWDKIASLRTLAQNLGMLKEKHEHTGADGGPIQYEVRTLTDEQLNERIKECQREIADTTEGEGEAAEVDGEVDSGEDPDATGTDLQAGGPEA